MLFLLARWPIPEDGLPSFHSNLAVLKAVFHLFLIFSNCPRRYRLIKSDWQGAIIAARGVRLRVVGCMDKEQRLTSLAMALLQKGRFEFRLRYRVGGRCW